MTTLFDEPARQATLHTLVKSISGLVKPLQMRAQYRKIGKLRPNPKSLIGEKVDSGIGLRFKGDSGIGLLLVHG
jgi:hypothetical protein